LPTLPRSLFRQPLPVPIKSQKTGTGTVFLLLGITLEAMTLIITALADDAVVQLSDRRLTRADGSVSSENAIKSICVDCVDARFSVAYTGLAEIDTKPTDYWLVDFLTRSRAALKTFPKLVYSVAEFATDRFRQLLYLGDRRGLTLVFSGFGPPGAALALVSNQQDSSGRWLSAVSDRFEAGFWLRNNRVLRKLALMVNGAEAAVTPDLRAAVRCSRRRFLDRSPEERVTFLVEVLRRAAKHPLHGRLIGNDCMGVVVTPDGGFRATYHTETDTAVSYMPHYVSVGISARDWWVSTDENQRPPWSPRWPVAR